MLPICGHCGTHFTIVFTPDQAIHPKELWQTSQPWDIGQEDQNQGQYPHEYQDSNIGIRSIKGTKRHLIPERVEPQPGLSWVRPSLVHHAPLTTQQVELLRTIWQGFLAQEQEGFGIIRLVEPPIGEQEAIESSTPCDVQ